MAIVTNQWLDKSQVNHEVQLILGKSDPSPTGRGFTGVSVEGFRAYASDKQQMMTELIRWSNIFWLYADPDRQIRLAGAMKIVRDIYLKKGITVSDEQVLSNANEIMATADV